MKRQREIGGILINLTVTETTGFSPVGHLTDQIFSGLQDQKLIDERVLRVERALEKYERNQMKHWKAKRNWIEK